MRRKTLTQLQVGKLPRKAKRYVLSDPTQPGLVLRVPPQGPVSFAAVAWRNSQQKWQTLGTTATLSLDEARALARDAIRKIQSGLPVRSAPLQSVGAVASLWLKLKVDGEQHRTATERRRIIQKYIVPHVGDRVFVDLRRSDIAALLDLLAERHGKPQADMVLRVLSAIMRWYERRDDEYRSPLTAGMRRSSPTQRERVLGDDEIRVFWKLADASGSLGAMLQIALLTGQRSAKLIDLRWSDIGADGVWHIRREPREKSNGGDLRLPPLAAEIIRSQPRLAGDDRIFRRPHSRSFTRFQQASGLAHFTPHDLRRTARSLMSRAGVQSEISELVLGHALQGVRRIYDRHAYVGEKAEALAKLAALIERILHPADNVVTLGAAS